MNLLFEGQPLIGKKTACRFVFGKLLFGDFVDVYK